MSILSSIVSTVGSAALGGIGGTVMHAIPEAFKFFDDKDKRKHELALADKELAQTKLQFDLDQQRSKDQIALVQTQGDVANNAGELQALVESVKAQGQLTGVKWIDGLSASVRPMTTYWILALYSLYKATVLWGAWKASVTFQQFGSMMWSTNDVTMLAGIFSFWFLDRKSTKMRAGK